MAGLVRCVTCAASVTTDRPIVELLKPAVHRGRMGYLVARFPDTGKVNVHFHPKESPPTLITLPASWANIIDLADRESIERWLAS